MKHNYRISEFPLAIWFLLFVLYFSFLAIKSESLIFFYVPLTLISFISIIFLDETILEKKLLKLSLIKVIVVILFLIWSLFFLKRDSIKIEYAITYTWGLISFWYWYKKYERDKEIEIIRYYTEKYNETYEEIKNNLMTSDNEVKTNLVDFRKIFNLWYEEYFLYSRWYISEELWKEWRYWIKEDLTLFILKGFEQYLKIKNLWIRNKQDYEFKAIWRWINFISPIWYFNNINSSQRIGNNYKIFLEELFIQIVDESISKEWINKDKKEWLITIKWALLKNN